MDLYEFKASLVYRASFTIARVTQKNSFSKKKKKKKNPKKERTHSNRPAPLYT